MEFADAECSEVERQPSGEGVEAQDYALFDYVKKHGVGHARLAIPESELAVRFVSSLLRMPRNCLLLAAQDRDQGEADVSWLVGRGIAIDVRDGAWMTPLHHAVRNGWKRCVQLLLKRAAKLTTDTENMSPFHYTVSHGDEEIAQLFLDAGTPIDTFVRREVWEATLRKPRVHFAMRDTAQKPKRPGKGLTALHLAAWSGHEQMTKFLLNHGVNPNFASEDGETPLHLALKRCLDDVQSGVVDLWNDSDYAIEGALNRCDDWEYDETWIQVEGTRSSIVALLLEHCDVDVNAQDVNGISPLHIAARERHNGDHRPTASRKGLRPLSTHQGWQTPITLCMREWENGRCMCPPRSWN